MLLSMLMIKDVRKEIFFLAKGYFEIVGGVLLNDAKDSSLEKFLLCV